MLWRALLWNGARPSQTALPLSVTDALPNAGSETSATVFVGASTPYRSEAPSCAEEHDHAARTTPWGRTNVALTEDRLAQTDSPAGEKSMLGRKARCRSVAGRGSRGRST